MQLNEWLEKFNKMKQRVPGAVDAATWRERPRDRELLSRLLDPFAPRRKGKFVSA